MTFAERLEYVAGDRKLYPWLMSLGLSSATISRMKKGKIPGIDQLIVITRAENVSLDWLIEGEGKPFLVGECKTDDDFAEEISSLREDGWEEIYPVQDPVGGLCAVVVTTPIETEDDGTTVRYTGIVILTGPVGERTIEVVTEWCAESKRHCHPQTLDRRLIADLVTGKLSVRQLVDGPDPILRPTAPGHAAEIDLQNPYATVEDPPTVQDVADMMRVLSPELQERVKAYVEGMTDAVDSVSGDSINEK